MLLWLINLVASNFDVCKFGTTNCDTNANCTSLPGGAYMCKCMTGYVGDGSKGHCTKTISNGQPLAGANEQCAQGQFHCTSAPYNCIAGSKVLDGKKDCTGGEDESKFSSIR